MPSSPVPWRILTVARKCSGHTGPSLALAAGMDKGHLSRLERGVREPTPELVAHLEEVLGLKPGDLWKEPTPHVVAEVVAHLQAALHLTGATTPAITAGAAA